LNRTKILSRKPEQAATGDERLAHGVKARVQNTARDAVRVLRIRVFLHSAKDIASVLKLHELEDSSGTA
jgi:hypothetical protein